MTVPEFQAARVLGSRPFSGNSIGLVGTSVMARRHGRLGGGMRRAGSLDVRSCADGIGIVGSAACALHCIAAPVLLVAGTTLPASFLTDESFHRILLGAILPASLLAFGLGCWRHKDRWVLLLGVLGLLGLSSPVVEPHDLISETGERWVTVGSAGILIAAHLRNFERCRAHGCQHEGVPA